MRSRRGSSLLEFTLVGIPVLFLTASVVNTSIAMWQFHTMEYALQVTDRYVALHGRSCSQNGNNCTMTVGGVATMIKTQAPSLDPSKLKVTLTTQSASVVCEPLNSCLTNSAQFPSTADNGVNFDVTLSGTYKVFIPVLMFWPGSQGVPSANYTLGATTRQTIQF